MGIAGCYSAAPQQHRGRARVLAFTPAPCYRLPRCDRFGLHAALEETALMRHLLAYPPAIRSLSGIVLLEAVLLASGGAARALTSA